MIDEASAKFSTAERIEQYKAYLQDLGNIGARHETARGFYLSVLSALLSFVALAGEKGPLKEINGPLSIVVGLSGIAISVLWLVHTLGFTALYAAKFCKLGAIEEELPFQIFGPEYTTLKRDWRYVPLTYVECSVAVVFIALFSVTIFLTSCSHS